MSLNANPFAGQEHADSAALEADGEWYVCTVCRDRANNRIIARVEVKQASGQYSTVFESVIDQGDDGDPSDVPESPKIIAVGTTFVVHWINKHVESETSTWTLHRATMDMEAFDASINGWDDRGSVALHGHALYDVCPIFTDTLKSTHATDFVVARKTAADTLTVVRYGGFDWIDTEWTATPTRTIYSGVLAVYANDLDNDVVLSYMKQVGGAPVEADDGLWTAHIDADDGGGFTDTETFPEFESSTGAAYLQVAHEYMGANTVAVVAEAVPFSYLNTAAPLDGIYASIHFLIFRTINSTSSANVSNAHWAAHLNQCSRPFSYVNGSGGRDLYVLASYKSINQPANSPRVPPVDVDVDDAEDGAIFAGPQANDWEQAYYFGLNLDYDLWDTVATGAGLRPRVVQTVYTVGIPDARPSRLVGVGDNSIEPNIVFPTTTATGIRVGKRMNHLAHAVAAPPEGRDVKTRSIAAVVFAGIGASAYDDDVTAPFDASGVELVPENAGISEILIYLEDPWTQYRNGENASAQPLDNFKGSNPRAMCQAVEIGKSTFFAGGTPYVYDGRQMVEAGYPWRPEMISAAVSNGSGALANNATYYVYFVYTWRDNPGQIHRSGPSPIYTFTTGASDDTVTYVLRTLTVSLKDATAHYPIASAIQIEVYRTAWNGAAGTIFYRVFGSGSGETAPATSTSTRDTPTNDPTSATTGFLVEGVSDAALVLQGLGPYQYATDANGNITGFPDVLVQTPPAMHAPCNWLNRLFAADSCDEGVLIYSDEIRPDYGSDYYEAPIFNDSQTFRMGDVGDIVAMQPMGNTLVVWTDKPGIYALQAADAGGGLLTIQMETLHEGTGCIEPRSLALAPPGIFFQSAKGYYLLDRSRDLDYASAGEAIVDDIREIGNVRAATHIEDKNQLKLAGNLRPVRQWTTTFTAAGDDAAGDWTITAGGVNAATTVGVGIPFSTVVNNLEDDFEAAIAAGTAVGIESVTSPGNTLVIVWEPTDEVPAYSSSAPAGNTLTGVDTSTTTTYPCVLVYDYRVRQWARHDLVQLNADERLSEVVDACAWRGLYDATTAHVVLCQGGLFVERGPTDALAFTDQTSTGNVGIPIDLQTAWYKFAGIAGYQRVRSISVVASKTEDTEYSIDLDYCVSGDFDVFETDANLTVASTTPGNLRVRPRIEKLTGIRVRIYEDAGVANTENIRVTGLVFEVGVKKGTRKVADTRIAS